MQQRACVTAERAMLAALDGSCRTPIAGLAEIVGGQLILEGLLLMPDGTAEIIDLQFEKDFGLLVDLSSDPANN